VSLRRGRRGEGGRGANIARQDEAHGRGGSFKTEGLGYPKP